jgi:hypothetical protein
MYIATVTDAKLSTSGNSVAIVAQSILRDEIVLTHAVGLCDRFASVATLGDVDMP